MSFFLETLVGGLLAGIVLSIGGNGAGLGVLLGGHMR